MIGADYRAGVTTSVPTVEELATLRADNERPVQTLETWLLVARGDTLAPAPESCFSYSRPNLKRPSFVDPSLPRKFASN
jgi:hypothetical protein